jgi:hypothetical protein
MFLATKQLERRRDEACKCGYTQVVLRRGTLPYGRLKLLFVLGRQQCQSAPGAAVRAAAPGSYRFCLCAAQFNSASGYWRGLRPFLFTSFNKLATTGSGADSTPPFPSSILPHLPGKVHTLPKVQVGLVPIVPRELQCLPSGFRSNSRNPTECDGTILCYRDFVTSPGPRS